MFLKLIEQKISLKAVLATIETRTREKQGVHVYTGRKVKIIIIRGHGVVKHFWGWDCPLANLSQVTKFV